MIVLLTLIPSVYYLPFLSSTQYVGTLLILAAHYLLLCLVLLAHYKT